MGSSPVRVKGKGVSETMIQQDNIPDGTKWIFLLVFLVISLLMAFSSSGK